MPLPGTRLSVVFNNLTLINRVTSSLSTTRTCARTIEDSSIKYTYRCCHATPDLRQSVVCDQLIFEISRDDTSRGREPFFPPPCPRLHRSPRRTQHSVNGRTAAPECSSYTKDGLSGFVHAPKLGALGVRKYPTASASHAPTSSSSSDYS